MELGKPVKGYRKQVWQANAPSILNRVNRAKYSQHANLRDLLVKAGGRLIGEATAGRTFGIGLSLKDETVSDSSTWSG